MTMPRWIVTLALLAAAFISAARGQTTRPAVSAIARVGMTVDDADRSIDFYTNVLTFTKTSDTEFAGEQFEHLTGVFGARARVVRLKLGDETIELAQYLTPRGRLVPRDSHSNDRWFQHIAIVTTDMDRAFARLRAHKVGFASTGPQRLPDWNPNAGGIKAFYFRDPDDHVLEIIWFPPGKGDPKWQERKGLFAGIDHTAIVVQDTEKSLAFYRDMLGMRVAGTSENYGTEQEHLNNVQGAHLRITSLRAAQGPGIELLEYLAPRDGRPYPRDEKPNDILHWQTTVLSDSADETTLVRDADGHVLQVTHP